MQAAYVVDRARRHGNRVTIQLLDGMAVFVERLDIGPHLDCRRSRIGHIAAARGQIVVTGNISNRQGDEVRAGRGVNTLEFEIASLGAEPNSLAVDREQPFGIVAECDRVISLRDEKAREPQEAAPIDLDGQANRVVANPPLVDRIVELDVGVLIFDGALDASGTARRGQGQERRVGIDVIADRL